MDDLDPTLLNIIEQKSLRWIFVGGKGGVGKTTCRRKRVLLMSTDPAHNISDAFDQKLTRTPVLVKGFENLYAMEVDPKMGSGGMPAAPAADDDDVLSVARQLVTEMTGSFPGIDEAMSFAAVMQLIDSMDFECVVLDTAPTGHTLRLLQFPSIVEQGLGKLMTMRNTFAPMVSQIGKLVGMSDADGAEATKKMEEILPTIRKINKQFRDPDQTTFICVCIAEFLSLYETERLVQELTKQGIDTHNVVVNQLLKADDTARCKLCAARYRTQRKYLEQIEDLYDDFHVTKLPLLEDEVRGSTKITEFSKFLLEPLPGLEVKQEVKEL